MRKHYRDFKSQIPLSHCKAGLLFARGTEEGCVGGAAILVGIAWIFASGLVRGFSTFVEAAGGGTLVIGVSTICLRPCDRETVVKSLSSRTPLELHVTV